MCHIWYAKMAKSDKKISREKVCMGNTAKMQSISTKLLQQKKRTEKVL